MTPGSAGGARPDETVAAILRAHPGATAAFARFGIDYCCGGERRLDQACAEAGAELEVVLRAIEEAPRASLRAPAFARPSELIAHILAMHHVFTREALARLGPLCAKVVGVHGAAHPELKQVAHVLQALEDDLLPHLQKEEVVLFPWVRALDAGGRDTARSVGPPIACMRQEHESVGVLLADLRMLTSAYVAPDGACGSYRALYAGLSELDADLRQHIHLENNVLFPAAMALDEKSRR